MGKLSVGSICISIHPQAIYRSSQTLPKNRELVMLPIVTHLKNIDGYRDGGSVFITFDGEEKYWYEFLLPVKLQYKRDERDRIVDFIQVGYLQPVLIINTPFEWTSKITGITHIEYKETKQPISWDEAIDFLETIKDLVEEFEMEGIMSKYYNRDRGLSIYKEMLDASKNLGVISN